MNKKEIFIEVVDSADKLRHIINLKHIVRIVELEDKTCEIVLTDSEVIYPKESYQTLRNLVYQ